MQKLKRILKLLPFSSIVCLNFYFILWLYDRIYLGTFSEGVYYFLFVPFSIWSLWLVWLMTNDEKEHSNSFIQGINSNLIKTTAWLHWISLLFLLLHFFNLFHDFGWFYIIFLIIICVIVIYTFLVEEGKFGSIFCLYVLNILGVLFHFSYYNGINSKDYKDLYNAYSSIDNFDKKSYYLKLIIEDPKKYKLTVDEVDEIIYDNKSYNGKKIFDSEHKYPFKFKNFGYTEHDSLVNHIVCEMLDTFKSADFYIFQEWVDYLCKYGHYHEALEFSKKYEDLLMKKLYKFKDWEEYFGLLKQGILPIDKLFPEDERYSEKWVDAYIELKRFQYHYYKYIRDEELMSKTLSEYYKIELHLKNDN